MKLSLRDVKLSDWLGLALGILCAGLAAYTHDPLMIIGGLFFGGGSLYAPFARKKANERLERRLRQHTEFQRRLYEIREAELQARLNAGLLSYLVEWWEEDNPYIDENAHMLFIFADGEEMDFELLTPTCEKLKHLLAAHGIEWEWSYRFGFDSRILYPPTFAGQAYYDSKGNRRKELT